MKKNFPLDVLFTTIWVMILSVGCQQPSGTTALETPEEYRKRMEWWHDARFGMFIHWGPYAVFGGEYKGKIAPGGAEWIMYTLQIPVKEYEAVARTFNPQDFDARRWVRVAKDAGMKYIVFTTKHHDGFCMWHTKLTDYNIVDYTPFHRDVLKELADACHEEGMKLGFYYSIMDWHHPWAHGDSFPKYRDEYMKPQLKELLTNYGKVSVLWFDGEWIPEWTEEQGKELYAYVRTLQPDIIVNNRVGKGRLGMEGLNKGQGYAGDFGTPEQGIPDHDPGYAWETCMTINGSWGYKKSDNDWKSTRQLLHYLIDIVSKGGNYLLNVGPDAQGVIPAPSVQRLQEMGQWLRVNGEAIYNTRSFLYSHEGEDIHFTMSKDSAYVYPILTRWPDEGVTLESLIPFEGSQVTMLGVPQPLEWEVTPARDLHVVIPPSLADPAARPCDYAWSLKVKGKAYPLAPAPVIETLDGQQGREILFVDSVTIRIHGDPKAGKIHYTLDGTFPLPSSPVYNGLLHFDTSVTVRAKQYDNEGVKSSFTATTIFHNARQEHLPVVAYRYYEGEWDSLPDFSALAPVRKGFAAHTSLRDIAHRPDHFGIVFEGTLLLPESGDYHLILQSDDGSRLFLDNNLVIDHDGLHGFTKKEKVLHLQKGRIPFRLEYFEATGGNGLQWTLIPPHGEEVDAAHFFEKM